MAQKESFDEDHIQQILVEIASGNGFVKPKFEVSVATKPGDNYSGRVIRAVVQEDGKEPLSLIFKAAPLSQIRREASYSGLAFCNEAAMYDVILPTLNVILREYGISNSDVYPCTARCLRTRISENWEDNAIDVIVLEDMAVKGYDTVGRADGLDAEQCRVILGQLALLHASSFALRRHRPEEARTIESRLKGNQAEGNKDRLGKMAAMLRNKMYLVEDRYPVGSLEHTKLKNFIDNFADIAMKVHLDMKANEEFECVIHGDCWSNNILFKYDKNDKIENICLIDFQIAKVTSPMTDVSRLLLTCTTKETRDEHYHSLIRGYYEELSAHLMTMGCDPESIYPWSTLQNQLKQTAAFAGLFLALIIIPAFMADSSELPDNLDAFLENSDSKRFADIFTSVREIRRMDECKERCSDILLDCVEYGYI